MILTALLFLREKMIPNIPEGYMEIDLNIKHHFGKDAAKILSDFADYCMFVNSVENPVKIHPMLVELIKGNHDILYCKEMTLKNKGNIVVQHKHKFDHLSILQKGSAKVTNGVDTEYLYAPASIVIKAHEHHSIEALEDDTVWDCVHAVTDLKDEDEVDVHIIER